MAGKYAYLWQNLAIIYQMLTVDCLLAKNLKCTLKLLVTAL
jgi:hypothetical protein